MKHNLALAIWASIIPMGYSAQVFRFTRNALTFTCNVDSMGNPYIDCLNKVSYFCSTTTGGNGPKCTAFTNTVFDSFSATSPWRSFGDNCFPGRVSSTTGIQVTEKYSTACNSSILNLKRKGYINSPAEKTPITDDIAGTMINFFWDIYGVNAKFAFSTLWPPISNPKYLLAGSVSSLLKRAQVFRVRYQDSTFQCVMDDNLNPTQACVNMVAYFCYFDATICKSAVKKHIIKFNINWRNYHNYCASWLPTANSASCLAAANTLTRNGPTFVDSQNSIQKLVNDAFINSYSIGLWNNATIRGSTDKEFSGSFY